MKKFRVCIDCDNGYEATLVDTVIKDSLYFCENCGFRYPEDTIFLHLQSNDEVQE